MYNLGQHFVIQPNNLKAKADVTFSGSKFRITMLTERLRRSSLFGQSRTPVPTA